MYQSFIYPSLFLNFLPLNLGNFQETIRLDSNWTCTKDIIVHLT